MRVGYLFCLIFLAGLAFTGAYQNQTTPLHVKSFLQKSDSLLDSNNEILSSLHSFKNAPFWLEMANQALRLQNKLNETKKKNLVLHRFLNKLPHLRKVTNLCLIDPWSNSGKCSFKTLIESLNLLCLVDNSNAVSSSLEVFKTISCSPNTYDYKIFCWITYGINYLEQCQSRLLIDEVECSIKNVEYLIRLMLTKSREISKLYTNNFQTIYSFFMNTFKERSMQILTEILILLKKNILLLKENHNEISIWLVQSNMEKLLDSLLNEYVMDVLESSRQKSCLLEGRLGYERCVTLIVKEKLKTLNDYSVKVIFKRVINLVKKI